jgi:hypothetical protein
MALVGMVSLAFDSGSTDRYSWSASSSQAVTRVASKDFKILKRMSLRLELAMTPGEPVMYSILRGDEPPVEVSLAVLAGRRRRRRAASRSQDAAP